MTLLLVEPSTLLRERLAAILASLGCVEIVETITFGMASQVIRTLQPKIVVMDAQLTDGSGLELLSVARAECPSACLIVVNPSSSEPYRKRWLQAGADHCFDLSVEIDPFLDVVMHHSQMYVCSIPQRKYQ
jgi:DNA-binding NarL/FixJ family response regulator